MSIPDFTMPRSIEHTLPIGGKIVRVSGTLDLETKTLTASAAAVDGNALSLEMGNTIKREVGQMYRNYKLILEY